MNLAEARNNDLYSEIEKKDNTILLLKTQLKAAQDANTELNDQVKTVQEKVGALESAMADSDSDSKANEALKLQSALNSARLQIKGLNEQLDEKNQQIGRLQTSSSI